MDALRSNQKKNSDFFYACSVALITFNYSLRLHFIYNQL